MWPNGENKDRRHGKRRLIQEWANIRRRWKRRKYDLRAESDVGGAVRSSFDHHLREGTPRDEPRQSRVDNSEEPDSVGDSKSRKLSLAPYTDDAPPSTWTDRLDDWAMGYQSPEVKHWYWSIREGSIVPKATPVFPSPSTNAPATPLGYVPAPVAKRTGDSSFRSSYFPSFAQRAPTWFIHSRSLQFMVSGVLIRETNLGPTRNETRQRLVAYLWDSGCLQRVPHSPSMKASRQNGKVLHYFLRCRWKRRREAALSLGIASVRRLGGPLKRLGERYSYSHPKLLLSKPLTCLIPAYADGTHLTKESRQMRCKSSSQSEGESVRITSVFPTTPSFPHDAHLVSFGPDDLYHNFFCNRDGLSRLACQLVMSNLLRASACEAKERSSRILASVNDGMMALNHGSVQKCISANRGRMEIPLIDYAFAIDSACALSSNLLPTRVLLDSEKGGEGAQVPIASTPFVDRWLHANSPKFSTVHVRFNLLYVAQCLPKPVSVSFLQSLDAGDNQTPFDAMRRFLDHLEASGVLIEVGSSSSCSNSVSVEELESILHGASASLMRILERNPLDFTCRCWHLATLAACMVLCSGNRVESDAAHRFPSRTTMQVADCNALLSVVDHGSVPHEIRRKLPKFQWLRFQASSAFRMLLSESVHRNDAARWHLAVVSFLEWRQALAFLLGSKMSERNIQRIQLEHERHSVWMSAYTCAPESHGRASHKSCNIALDGFARLLESYPAEEEHWLQLVRELGRFCDPAIDKHRFSCNCPKCLRLHRSRQSLHESAPLDDQWWGSSRVSWWDGCILSQTAAEFIGPSNLSNEGCSSGRGDFEALPRTTDPLEWLGDGEFDDNADREEETHSAEERTRNFANCLSFDRSRTFGSLNNPAAEREDFPSIPSGFKSDLLKLIIRGHLYGVTDRVFEARVVSLAQDSWDFSNGCFRSNSDSFSALRYLHHKGLSLATIFQRANIPSTLRTHEMSD